MKVFSKISKTDFGN